MRKSFVDVFSVFVFQWIMLSLKEESVVYRRSLTGLWQDSAMVLPGFVLGCHVLGQVLGKVWTCSGQCWRYWDMARTWKKYGKNQALARVAFCHFSRCL